MKLFFANIKNFFAVLIWNTRIIYQRAKEKVSDFCWKIINKITFKDKRDEKRRGKDDIVKEYVGLVNPEADIRFDVNLPKLREELNVKIVDVKSKITNQRILLKNKPSEENQAKYQELTLEYNRLNEVLKALPPTRKQIERREKMIGIGKSWFKAALYLAPVLILLGIFSFYPIVNAFRLVIYKGYSEVDGSIEGYTVLGNFITVLKDANFIVPASHTGSSAMINTLVIVVVTVPLSIIIALLISVALNSIKPLKSFFQTVFFLPYVTNALALGLVFAYIFRTDGGLFNRFLQIFGIQGGAWVGVGASYFKAMFVLIIFNVWKGLAFKIMVFLSAIQGIDKQYYQAAAIDATPRFKQFMKITVPLISPTIFYIVVTSVIGAFKTYSSVIAIFGNSGKPAGAKYNLKTIVFYIYDFFNTTGKLSEAAAASIILFVIILIMTLIQMQVSKKRVHY